MLNFRKLREDFSSGVLNDGKSLFHKEFVLKTKILHLDRDSIRLQSKVKGTFEHVFDNEIEIDRNESIAIDSNCSCSSSYDCQHIAAILYYLEKHLDKIVVQYSQETDLDQIDSIDEEEKKGLIETFQQAETKEDKRRGEKYQKEVLQDYQKAATMLQSSSIFLPCEKIKEEQGELLVLFSSLSEKKEFVEASLSLRLQSRAKIFTIPDAMAFLEAIRFAEPISLGGHKLFFTMNSFDPMQRGVIQALLDDAFPPQKVLKEESQARFLRMRWDALGVLFAEFCETCFLNQNSQAPMPSSFFFVENLEQPLVFSNVPAHLKCELEYLEAPAPTFLLKPFVCLEQKTIPFEKTLVFASKHPGVVAGHHYYRFSSKIKRAHLKSLHHLHEMAIPEPLFGTFIENTLPVFRQSIDLMNPGILAPFVTLPYVERVTGRCQIEYLDGELEARLFFTYGTREIPACFSQLSYEDLAHFIDGQGVTARNLKEEHQIVESLFSDFLFDEKNGIFRVKNEKKIVEFMTEIVPAFQNQIVFECPENLSDQFVYEETYFTVSLKETDVVHEYSIDLQVEGSLKGIHLKNLWECLALNKCYIELKKGKETGKKRGSRLDKILVLDLQRIRALAEALEEMGVEELVDKSFKRPLWSLTYLTKEKFKDLPINFSISRKLQSIQKQILSDQKQKHSPVPSCMQVTLRSYQEEGVHWLEKLRSMYLNGILADDMGLGKTVQAITALTQNQQVNPKGLSLLVCPTSLVYNWKAECEKFNPNLKVLVVDSIPAHRQKKLKKAKEYDVVVTSYNLMQKDIEIYTTLSFDYVILDEAQHIKNRTTRNAQSVKKLQGKYRLILTGTPIENSLEELWSLFDFLMPGFLSTYDRFVEKYLRACSNRSVLLEELKRKVSPFILRRMKEDVLHDLPPVSQIMYHCHLSDVQKELYSSYAASAKEELSRLVKKDGFDKIQIHVLATLTRLKQICCHPAIFAKENPEVGDSSKYDLLLDLLGSLVKGNHKTVIFSQYTKMLGILREDLQNQGISFAYLDGSTKNRLDVVNQFNADPKIPIFLVSLKAGGAGLNLVGADTVIHYDMWWNPAVENQATDRVHRIGQDKPVSSYKLVTLNTIEEKILKLQNRKKGLVKKIIQSDDEVMGKLTWEEVLELLQT